MFTEARLRMTYDLPSKLEVDQFMDLLEKGKAAPIGEVRTWSGQQYVKHSDGWVHVHPTTGKVSVLPTSGPIKKLDGNDEHKAHFEKHTSPKTEVSDLKAKDGNNKDEQFKEGNSYYYKNQYMQEALKLKLVHKQEWANGELDSLEFNKPDGSSMTLKSSDAKYITSSVAVEDGQAFEKKLSSFIYDELNESPSQLLGVIKSIDQKQPNGVSTMTFTEEVKDGRQPRFNSNTPLQLKGKQFSHGQVLLKIQDVKYLGQSDQSSDYNQYVDSKYSISYSIQYQDNASKSIDHDKMSDLVDDYSFHKRKYGQLKEELLKKYSIVTARKLASYSESMDKKLDQAVTKITKYNHKSLTPFSSKITEIDEKVKANLSKL